ncbi:protein transport protein bet1 [Umbelopsis sp. WA50703]
MSRQFGTNNVRQFQNLHNRAALFGDRDDRPSSAASGRYTPTRFGALDSNQHDEGSYRVKMDDSDLDYLESQNDTKIHGLSAKVAVLKNVSASKPCRIV